jgi:adenosylmethionine-8-amino-7-oxononanoate aminotransferase
MASGVEGRGKREPNGLDPTVALELKEWAAAHVWPHWAREQADARGDVRIITRGEGCWVFDEAGKKYLDARAGGVCVVHCGHGRPEIAQAVHDQIMRLAFFKEDGFAHEPAIRLAHAIAQISPPGLSRVFLTSTGTEAVETTLKLARQYWRIRLGHGRKMKILAREGAYHGATYGAMSATGMQWRRELFEPLVPGFVHIKKPGCHSCHCDKSSSAGMACIRDFEQVVQAEGPETIAAIICDPIMVAGGVIIPPLPYYRALRQLCDEEQILLIFDEIISGFGRTGEWFAGSHWGVLPDMIACAKGVSSGYIPLGAAIVQQRLYSVFADDRNPLGGFRHGYTYGGHPVACAAGLANLELLERERLVERAKVMGGILLQSLESLRDIPLVRDIRGVGLLVGVEVGEPPTGGAGGTKQTAALGQRINEALLRRGVICRVPSNVLAICPPLIITEEEVTFVIGAVRDALIEVGTDN